MSSSPTTCTQTASGSPLMIEHPNIAGSACAVSSTKDIPFIGLNAAVHLLTHPAAPAAYVCVSDIGIEEASGGGGYDTHTNQVNQHERLLKDLGDSVKSFVADLQAQGNFQRVLMLTFSEFGRRVTENANGGTDHGAAAPMFVVGPKVKAGLHGKYPSLATPDLFNGDLRYNVDFRSVYAGVLEEWLKTKSEPILGRKFEPLALV